MVNKWLGLAGLVGGILIGCKSDTAGPDLPNLVGTWRATRADVSSVANPVTTQELISQGLTFTLVLNANLTCVITTAIPGEGTEVSSGTYVQAASSLVLTITSPAPTTISTFGLGFSGNTLTLTGGDINFDFGSGTEVPAKLNLILMRQ